MSYYKLPVIGIVVFIIGTILALFPECSLVHHLDTQLAFFANNNRPKSLDTEIFFFSDNYNHMYMPFLIILIIIGLYKRNSSLLTKTFLVMGSVTTSVYLKDSIKDISFKDRIWITHPTIENVVVLPKSSFPSGHVCTVFALAVAFWILFPNQKVLRAIVMIWSILIIITRITLGIHYPSDIIAALGLATFVGSTFAICGRDMILKPMKKV